MLVTADKKKLKSKWNLIQLNKNKIEERTSAELLNMLETTLTWTVYSHFYQWANNLLITLKDSDIDRVFRNIFLNWEYSPTSMIKKYPGLVQIVRKKWLENKI